MSYPRIYCIAKATPYWPDQLGCMFLPSLRERGGLTPAGQQAHIPTPVLGELSWALCEQQVTQEKGSWRSQPVPTCRSEAWPPSLHHSGGGGGLGPSGTPEGASSKEGLGLCPAVPKHWPSHTGMGASDLCSGLEW